MKLSKVLYIAVGAPNSGKTTTIKNRINGLGGARISRDDIRFALVKPEEGYFTHEGQVFETFIKLIQEAIDNPRGPRDVYADATHLNKASRKKLIKHLNLDCVDKIIIMSFHCPKEILIERNLLRNGKERLPLSALERMIDSMDTPSINEHPLFEIWDIDEYGYIRPEEPRRIFPDE